MPQLASQTVNSTVLAQTAIAAALSADWPQAVKINEKILRITSDDVEALNRLARAYFCLGQLPKALKNYKKALSLDPHNLIARKSLDKVASFRGNGENGQSHKTNGHRDPSPNGQVNLSQIFLDEPGRTKLVSLLNLAPPAILALTNCADQVVLNPKNHSITVSNLEGTYLGAFPDDLAHRLLTLIAAGNQYQAYVRSCTTKSLTIFVRETIRAQKFANQPSFQSRSAQT